MVLLTGRSFIPVVSFLVWGCGYEVLETIVVGSSQPPPPAASATSRDKLTWPFSVESIWNMPLGADAEYVPAQLLPPTAVDPEQTYFVVVNAADPLRQSFEPGPKPDAPCSGTVEHEALQVPDSFVLSAAGNASLANATSLLMPDGRTLRELVSVARCEPAGPIFAYPGPIEDIYGLGLRGAQGGSGLSAVGGSLRAGELTGRVRLQHAVKLALWGERYLFFDPANTASCYRWPADRCDASAPDAGSLGYHGADPGLVQGALLALPPQITADQLGLETAPGKLLFGALQDYGAYVVGNSGSDAVLLGFDALGLADFERTYGYEPESKEPGSEAWSADVRKMVASLQLIANNGPSSVGGGGAPRRELAPPFRD